MEHKKFEYIDSLRGIAILLVIIVHIPILGDFNYSHWLIEKFIYNGKLGVQLFFVTSAFTLILSYNNRIGEQNKNKKFFIRRFFRIAPFYYIMAIFMLFDNLLKWNIVPLTEYDNNILPKFLTHIFFVNSLSPKYILSFIPGGWTISVEFLFYLTVPLICNKIKNLNSCIKFVCISIILSFVINRLLSVFIQDGNFEYFNPISQFPVFTLGFLAYYIINDNQAKIKASTIGLCLSTILFFCYFRLPYHILYSFMFGGLIVLLSIKPYKVLSNKIIAQIGKVSFSMYIIHFIVIYTLIKLNINTIIGFNGDMYFFILYYFLIAAISYCISFITYTYIEKPFQNIGRKIIGKIN